MRRSRTSATRQAEVDPVAIACVPHRILPPSGVLGAAVLARFATKHADSRRPLQRFLEIARSAEWPDYPAVKDAFGATDKGKQSGRLIFDIGGNKYRLIASVDFAEVNEPDKQYDAVAARLAELVSRYARPKRGAVFR